MPKITDPAIIEANALRMFGCSRQDAIALNDGQSLRSKNSKAMAYQAQRLAAAKRGVAWSITLPEWLSVWSASGKWSLRGVGVDRYCMARHGDEGPYSVGNISIQLCTRNSSDGIAKARAKQAAIGRHLGPDTLGKGRGWTLRKKAALNPYQVVVAKKYIGCFQTQGEAEAAYLQATVEHAEVSLKDQSLFRSPRGVLTNGY